MFDFWKAPKNKQAVENQPRRVIYKIIILYNRYQKWQYLTKFDTKGGFSPPFFSVPGKIVFGGRINVDVELVIGSLAEDLENVSSSSDHPDFLLKVIFHVGYRDLCVDRSSTAPQPDRARDKLQ